MGSRSLSWRTKVGVAVGRGVSVGGWGVEVAVRARMVEVALRLWAVFSALTARAVVVARARAVFVALARAERVCCTSMVARTWVAVAAALGSRVAVGGAAPGGVGVGVQAGLTR